MGARAPTRAGLAGLVTLAVVAAVASVLPAGPAGAHEGGEGLSNLVDSVLPVTPGLTVAVVASVADEVVVENRSPEVATVADPGGRPFLRIGPQGVAADINAPFWYASNNPGAAAVLPPGVTTSAEPRWARVAAEPSWGWFDPRLPGRDVEAHARPAPGTVVRLASWAIPLDVGGHTVRVSGHQEYSPVTGSVRARVIAPPPASTGLTLTLVPGGRAPGVFASWSGTTPVTVLGETGEPFIRFGPTGVDANPDSPTWRAAQQARGQTPAEDVSGSTAPGTSGSASAAGMVGGGRWQHLDDAPRASWIDPRLTYRPGVPPPDVQARREPSELLRWSIPVEAATVRTEVAGVTEWVPDGFPGAFAPNTGTSNAGAPGRTRHLPAAGRVLAIVAALAALGWGLWRRVRAGRH
ncbi:MAG: hypothetical protein NVS3B12_23750 [Acidimicrobiales bacterium]